MPNQITALEVDALIFEHTARACDMLEEHLQSSRRKRFKHDLDTLEMVCNDCGHFHRDDDGEPVGVFGVKPEDEENFLEFLEKMPAESVDIRVGVNLKKELLNRERLLMKQVFKTRQQVQKVREKEEENKAEPLKPIESDPSDDSVDESHQEPDPEGEKD